MNWKFVTFEKHSDKRGELIVFLKHDELETEKKTFGQIYFVTFNKKGIIRGNHYHKKWHEWFGIVDGKLEVALLDLETMKKNIFILDAKSDKYKRLEIGPNVVHAFKSISSHAALLNYADAEWSDKDDYSYTILQ